MVQSFWLQNGMGGKHILVDMGSAEEQAVRDATDRLAPMLGRGNIQIVGNARVTVRLSPKKADAILAQFPQIVAGAAGYCWCTHGWKH
ncbi:MAG TPA: hypothetical protein VNU68_35305 [Verrucomicrobiae bacterium]|nr:hypothetical protein [Verrucomicrobiae bacterium]